MPPLNNITGQKFGRLLAIERVGVNRHQGATWLFVCDCGKTVEKSSSRVKRGMISSCGCLRKESESMSGKRNIKIAQASNVTHGKSSDRICRIWRAMKDRCSNINSENFKNYGGRGIVVCDEWLNSSESFFNWATQNGYSDDLSLDRKDNNLGYSPGNCKWSTRSEQARNTRQNHSITIDGETKLITDWSKDYGISDNIIRARINRGWSVEDAVMQPIIKPPYTLNGNGAIKVRS